MSSLHVTLLGGFEVRDATGRVIAITGTKTVLLLAYLALRPGEAQTRDKLVGLLWSDREDSQARGSLRQAIWALRRALERIEPCPLVVHGETLSLDRDAVETDVRTLERLAADGSIGALHSALALYRGAVLEGLRVRDPAFEAFLRGEQSRVHDLVVDAFARLLEARRGDESDEAVAAVAKDLLKIDPLQELAHRALISHYAATGQMALAVRQYQACSDSLRQELDVEPSAETRSLIEEVRRTRLGGSGGTGRQADSDGKGAASTKPLPGRRAAPTIAVLPFLNLSGDPEQEYFSDGLTEDIITALALWRTFPVIDRNSSFVYKGKAADVKQVGRDLGANYVLEGSVRKSGSHVRIGAQLVDAASGHHVWIEKFDRDLVDVFALQDEIAGRIAATLEPALGKAELRRSSSKPPGNLDAWDYCLRGRAHLHDFTKAGTAKARAMFERAVALDPDYGEAFANLARTHSRDLLLETTDDRDASVAKMYEAARRAVLLDDASSLAHFVLSTAHLWRNEQELAMVEGRRAIELNPNSAEARHALGNKLDLAGDRQGIAMMEQAQALNPHDPQGGMRLTFLARAYVNIGQYDKAAKCARDAIQRQPDYANAHYILAIALGHLDRRADAQAALTECERLHPGFVRRRSGWQPYLDPASNELLHKGLRRVGLQP